MKKLKLQEKMLKATTEKSFIINKRTPIRLTTDSNQKQWKPEDNGIPFLKHLMKKNCHDNYVHS